MKLTDHDALMRYLASLHDRDLPVLLSSRGTLDYVDLPMYGNVGDLLIMAGTLRWFKRHGLQPNRIATYFNYDVNCADPNSTIVCQGGGNFGDIYGPFQRFRERIIANRTDCRVVVLPQSLHFSDSHALRATAALCHRHPDLHICVRDPFSEGLARQMTDHVYLLPDMAHQLWPVMPTANAPNVGVLNLRRRDAEILQSFSTANSFDWDDLVGSGWRFALSNLVERPVTQACLRLNAYRLLGNWLGNWWIGRAGRFIDQATALFSGASEIHSDRLHAHILSCLLFKPNVIDDNSYGKNSRYIDAWTAGSPLVTLRTRVTVAEQGVN